MKKVLFFALVLTLAAGAVFGEDAKTMPKMVGRLWIAPTFAFANGGYDTDGSYKNYSSGEGAIKFLNLGFALEYGVIDWITAAVQWAPGVTVWSEMDSKLPLFVTLPPPSSNSSVNINGVADLFVGAKIQIAGEKAPVKTDRLRFAIGPGVKIPFPGQNFDDQFTNSQNENAVTASNLDKHVFGLGTRVYFDYIINEHFFINLYNETIFYPFEGGLNNIADLISAKVASSMAAEAKDIKVKYGYDLTFELEPVFSTPLGSGITFTAGLPINYKFTPGHSYSVSAGNGALVSASDIEKAIKDNVNEDEPTHMLKVKPNISFFFTSWFLPTDIGLTYGIPVWGQNNLARHEITLKVKLYFALPGAR
jgi:hypothetical protein